MLCSGLPAPRRLHALGKFDVVVTGDIGCYSLGVLPPLSRMDTILCMGGGVSMAHGMDKAGEPRKVVGIVGDSTFFHSGITGLLDIAYNHGAATIIVVDNRTTAMTGHQDHPGTGSTLMGDETIAVSIEEIGRACGIKNVVTRRPLRREEDHGDAQGGDFLRRTVADRLPRTLPPGRARAAGRAAAVERGRLQGVRGVPEAGLPGDGRRRGHADRSTACSAPAAGCATRSASSARSSSPRRPGHERRAAGERSAGGLASGDVSVVLAGVGGQGILLASEIVARAAMAAGFDVKTNEVHGMAQRGGSVIAQIRYGPEVFSPLVAQGTARVLGALERIEALRQHSFLAPDGLAVVSSQAIVPVTVSSGQATYPADVEERLRAAFPRLVYVDAVEKATELGNLRAANVVVLGAMAHALDLPDDAWHEAIRSSVKPAAPGSEPEGLCRRAQVRRSCKLSEE